MAKENVDYKGNTGNGNSGHQNTGNRNSGDWNSGNWNSGYWNSGDWNSGNWNSGDWNSGNWNSGHRNSGYFNTTQAPVRIFNAETDMARDDIDFPEWLYEMKITEWVDYKDMSDQEKLEYPLAEYTGGYTKEYDYKEAFRNAFDNAKKEDVVKTLNLPNFDYGIFEEITGISKLDFQRKLGHINTEQSDEIIVINGVIYRRVD